MKKYFTFPENNKSLWDLVCMQKEGTNDVLCSKQKDTFSEKDFEKYFNQLFFSQYVKCLLKLKSQELFEKGNYTTPFFIEKTADGYSLRYWIDAVFDKKTKMLELRYYIYTYEGNYLENQNDNVVGETLIEYDFKYDENCIPKFHRLIMAG
ncbi:MAG: hypothetical protein LBP34_09440 [Flavobacteriaceae bacterium]|nr:hypothetical protein [Flavobacteriaceae bacterium]